MVRVSNLKKTYRGALTTAVNGISFNVGDNDIFGLLGPNGAGKTTTIKVLCGLLTPDSGSVSICGYDINRNRRKIKSLIGLVPQDIALYPNFTADENLRIFGGLFGMKGKERNHKADDLLKKFGLYEYKAKRISTYSGGMKRRLNLAAAMLPGPKVLFLDEPTVGIDVQSKVVIMENLKEISRQGTAMIYTSHQLHEAEKICTNVAIIDEGKILAQGPAQHLISQTVNANDLEGVYLQLTGHKLRDAK